MRGIKILVLIMGLLLIIGLGILVWGMSHQQMAQKQTPPIGHLAPPLSSGLPYTVDIPIPAGAHVEHITAVGDKLALHLSSMEGERILLIDSQTGKTAGVLSLVPAGR